MAQITICTKCKSVYTDSAGLCSVCGVATKRLNYSNIYWGKISEEEQKKIIDENCADATATQTEDEVTANNEATSQFTLQENMISTTDFIPGREIEQSFGTVCGTNIYLVGGLLGGGLMTQESLFGSAFYSAKQNMYRKAVGRGADAVIGMQVNVTSPGNLNDMIVVVTGTAVKLKEQVN